MRHIFNLLLVVSMVFTSCKQNQPAGTTAANDEKAASPVAAAKGRYSLKSGTVEYKGNIMGFSSTQTTWFDDFGAKEASETVMDMMGTTVRTLMIIKDGFVYNIDPDKKTGSRTSAAIGSANINFENLTDEIIKEWNIKKEGQEEVLGRSCQKYSLENSSFSIKGNYWVWKGVAIKMDMDMSSMKMLIEAVNIQENSVVPVNKFDVPEGTVIQ